MEPKEVAGAIRRLRDDSVRLLDGLSDEEVAREALPGWSVLDVFRHLADSDRRTVVGAHLLEFLPGRDLVAFERVNDDNLDRLRGEDRHVVAGELARWGRRLAAVVALVPAAVARVTVPTAFGRVPLVWLAGLRPYDEWVHQWDVRRAIGAGEPPMDGPLRDLLAAFQLRALAAGPIRRLGDGDGVVEVRFTDAVVSPWRFDLQRRELGEYVRATPTAVVSADVPSWCLVAAHRIDWRDAAGIEVSGRDEPAAHALLDLVRII